MPLPVVHGVIARRGLVNYRVDPDALAGVLSAPFRPQLVDAHRLAVDRIASSFFEDVTRFPPGSVAFDSALVMRDVSHEWHAIAPLDCGRRAGSAA